MATQLRLTTLQSILPTLRVEVSIQRRSERITTARSEREGLKARDILVKYPEEKAKTLMASLRSRNLWYFDPDFPQDEEDCTDWFGMRIKIMKNQHCVFDQNSLDIQTCAHPFFGHILSKKRCLCHPMPGDLLHGQCRQQGSQ